MDNQKIKVFAINNWAGDYVKLFMDSLDAEFNKDDQGNYEFKISKERFDFFLNLSGLEIIQTKTKIDGKELTINYLMRDNRTYGQIR